MLIKYKDREPINLSLVRKIKCAQIRARAILPYIEPLDCSIVFVFTSGHTESWSFPDAELAISVYAKIMDKWVEEVL